MFISYSSLLLTHERQPVLQISKPLHCASNSSWVHQFLKWRCSEKMLWFAISIKVENIIELIQKINALKYEVELPSVVICTSRLLKQKCSVQEIIYLS
jgi:hypothetical protein